MTKRCEVSPPKMTVGDLYRLLAKDDYDAYPVLRYDVVVGFVTKLDA
ncbi:MULTISPECIES: CBS domain-containing protein [Bradyrhizobium]|nr:MULTISPECIES: CBS domain-containing protein [Bradyrhizobium]